MREFLLYLLMFVGTGENDFSLFMPVQSDFCDQTEFAYASFF